MKIQHLYESDNTLIEMQVRRGWRLCESVTRGMTQHQRLIVENIYRELIPLIEASLTADQIKSLFGQIEQGATAAGSNRTMLGKGVDVVKKADEVVNNIGKWLQNTEPVKNFDQKFEQLKAKATEKFPEISKQMSKLGQLAKDNPGTTAAIVGILTAIAALGGGPVGGAIAGQILRGSVELLKGEKLSTALGKGIKTAAYGFIAGKTFELIGDVLGDGIRTIRDTLVPGAVRGNFSRIFDQVGGPLGDRFASFELKDLVGNPEDVGPMIKLANQAADAWQAGDYELSKTLWSQVQDGVEAMYTPEYLAQLASDQSTRELIGQGAKAVSGLADFMGAAAQGAIAAGVGSKDQKKESVYRQTRPLSEGQVYLLFRELERLDEGPMDFLKKAGKAALGAVKGAAGAVAQKVGTAAKNMTTKITADKLTSAWTKAGAPTDSDELYKFLTDQGVNSDVVKTAYQAMKIAPPKDAGASAAPAQEFKAGQEVTYVNAKGQEKTATVVGMLDTKDAQGDPQIQLKSGGATFAVDRDKSQSPGGGKQEPADDEADSADQTQQQGRGAAPAGTIGLAQEPGTEKPAAGTADAPDEKTTGGTTSGATASGEKPTSGTTASGGAPSASTGGAVDIYKLAKEIKQMKPEVIDAVKKVLSSKQSQLGK